MTPEMIDETVLFLQERRCQLEARRVAILAQLNEVAGGIAEMDYLSQVLAASKAAVCDPVAPPQE